MASDLPNINMAPSEVEKASTEPHELEMVHSNTKALDGFAQHLETQRTAEERRIERRFLLKVDLVILPILALMLFLASLDRGNTAYAYLAGMGKELEMTSQQLSACVSLFYVGYIIMEPPATLFLKRVTARVQLSLALIAWGTLTTLLCVTHSWSAVAGLRVLIGCGEAFLQAAGLYLTFFYKRDQLATRGSIYFSMFAIAGSINGLISYGLLENLNNVHGWLAWRWIFFVEGLMSVGFGFFVFLALPSSPEKLGWAFTEAEKEIALRRYREAFNVENDTKVRTAQIVAVLKDPMAWLYTAVYCTTEFSLAAFGSFLPVLVKGFGFSVIDTNLITIPIWVFAAVCIVATGVYSDRRKERGWILLCCLAIAAMGYIVLLIRPGRWGQFVATLLVGGGSYPQVVLIQSWINSNMIGYTKRATMLAMILMLGQLFSIASAQNYSDAPKYYRGNGLALGMTVVGFILTAYLIRYIAAKNASKRLAQESDQAAAARQFGVEEIQNEHPDFMYYL